MGAEKYFQKLGLGEYESRALSALIISQNSTAETISETANIPYTKIYQILNSLEKQGLIKSTLERPKKYQTQEPKEIVELILQRKKEGYETLKTEAKEGLKELKETTANKNIETIEKAHYVNGNENVWKEVEKLGKKAKKSIYVIADEEAWLEAYKRQSLVMAWYDAAVKRNVHSENIFPSTMPFDFFIEESNKNPGFDSNEYYKTVRNFDCDVKKIKHTVIIVDEEEVALAFKDERDKIYAGIMIKDKNIAEGMVEYFKALRQSGNEIKGLRAFMLWISSKSKSMLKNR